MRLAMFVGAAVSLVAASVGAAPGDPLIITGDGVNVRSGPGTSSSILLRAYRNQEAIELGREGEWVRLEIAGTAGQEGWIHSSLLARPGGAPLTADDEEPAPPAITAREEPAPEAEPPETVMVPELSESAAGGTDIAVAPPEAGTGSVAPGAGPVMAGPEVARFKESVDYLNKRAMQVAGVDLFTDVEAVDDLTVKVGITDAWTTVPPAGQRSYLNTLLDRWSAANGGTSPVTLQIVDPDGQLLAEETRP